MFRAARQHADKTYVSEIAALEPGTEWERYTVYIHLVKKTVSRTMYLYCTTELRNFSDAVYSISLLFCHQSVILKYFVNLQKYLHNVTD